METGAAIKNFGENIGKSMRSEPDSDVDSAGGDLPAGGSDVTSTGTHAGQGWTTSRRTPGTNPASGGSALSGPDRDVEGGRWGPAHSRRETRENPFGFVTASRAKKAIAMLDEPYQVHACGG